MGKLSQGPELLGELTIRTNRESREKTYCFLPVSLFQLQALLCLLQKCLRGIAIFNCHFVTFTLSFTPEFITTFFVQFSSLPTTLSQWMTSLHQYSKTESLELSLIPFLSIPPNLYLILISLLEKYLSSLNFLSIPTVSGRFSCHQTFSSDIWCQSQPLIGEVDVLGSEMWQNGK